MLKLRKIAPAGVLALAIAAIVIPNASAQIAAPLTIVEADEIGVTVRPPAGWQFDTTDYWDDFGGATCSAWGWDEDSNMLDASDQEIYSPYEMWIEWDEWADAPVTDASAICDLKRTTSTWGWKTFRKVRQGWDTSSRWKSDGCYINNVVGSLWLDCWGGAGAKATWRFNGPGKGARKVKRTIVGHTRCCSRGTLTRSWSGNTATVYVTDTRAYEVDRVVLSYQKRGWKKTVTHKWGEGDWTAPN